MARETRPTITVLEKHRSPDAIRGAKLLDCTEPGLSAVEGFHPGYGTVWFDLVIMMTMRSWGTQLPTVAGIDGARIKVLVAHDHDMTEGSD